MKLDLEINNLSGDPIKKIFFEKVFKKTFDRKEFAYFKNKKLSISLALVSPEEIRRLNKIYRKKNSITDVLSFSEYKNSKEIEKALGKNIFLGEVILCYNYIKKCAKQKKLNSSQELAEVFSHGILHLLGFRHSQKMFKIQKEVSNNLF